MSGSQPHHDRNLAGALVGAACLYSHTRIDVTSDLLLAPSGVLPSPPASSIYGRGVALLGLSRQMDQEERDQDPLFARLRDIAYTLAESLVLLSRARTLGELVRVGMVEGEWFVLQLEQDRRLHEWFVSNTPRHLLRELLELQSQVHGPALPGPPAPTSFRPEILSSLIGRYSLWWLACFERASASECGLEWPSIRQRTRAEGLKLLLASRLQAAGGPSEHGPAQLLRELGASLLLMSEEWHLTGPGAAPINPDELHHRVSAPAVRDWLATGTGPL